MDYTVRILVHDLQPDRVYFYRFQAGTFTSPTGRTRTAPAPDNPRPVRFAWASCQSYEAGFFGAYRTLLNRDQKAEPDQQIEFLLHTGDFIYEKLGYGSTRNLPEFPSGGQFLEGEEYPFAATLEDYRHLYKIYLADPDLQAARARWPCINTWDDHEFSNDCWQSMATYTPEGSPSQKRKVAANKAWFEFIPAFLSGNPGVSEVDQNAHDFSTPAPKVENAPFQGPAADGLDREPNNRRALDSLCIYRSFRWGKQVELVITDTRSYRTDHPIPDPLNQKIAGTNNYLSPLPLVKIFDAGKTYNQGNPPQNIPFAGQEIPNPRWNSAPGTLLGQEQKKWFKETLKNSDARWKIWANSVPAMPMRLDMEQINPEAVPIIFTTDTWEGFQVERQELFDFLVAEKINNLISLVGDHHNNFAGELFQDFEAEVTRTVGVEFAVCGISSPSIFHSLLQGLEEESDLRPLVTFDDTRFGGQNASVNNLNVTFTHGTRAAVAVASTGDWKTALAQRNPQQNPHLAYVDSSANGIAVITVGSETSEVEMITTEPPWEDRGTDGAAILRSAYFTVPAREPGQQTRLMGPRIVGTRPFPLDR